MVYQVGVDDKLFYYQEDYLLRDKKLGIFNTDSIHSGKYLDEGSIDLIYLDPPFGTGITQKLGKFKYEDKIRGEQYLEFLDKRLEAIFPLLHENGFLAIHLDQDHVCEVKNWIDENYNIPFKGDIIWSYRRWSSQKPVLQNNHDTILIYSFNSNYFLRRSMFSVPIIAPSSRERCGYPTQKPLALIKKIINHFEEYTQINTVLDPFMGSGSTLVAGAELGKKVYGFDISKDAYKVAKERLQNVGSEEQLTLI